MARFYFQPNHRDPTFEDHQGIEPPDLDDARQAATRAARAFIHAEAEKGEPCTSCCVEVSSAAELHAKAALSAIVVDGPNR